jgi:prepilin signal peptidase PulO-like enzyme (type II secretory pathway)
MDSLGIIGPVLLGLVLGSFATALSYRIPRGLSIFSMLRSQCPACRKNLGVPDLVPLLSWMALRGRCRHCRAPIGWRYPLIELATLFLCLMFYSVYGMNSESLLIFLLAPLIVSILDIDLHYKIIPDSLNLSILLTGIAALFVNALISANSLDFLIDKGAEAVGASLIYGLGALLLRQGVMLVMKREPLGLGDVKFFAVAGFWLGLNMDAAALFMLVSGLSGIAFALAWKKRTGDAEVPFGPSLIVAFVTALYFYAPGFINL